MSATPFRHRVADDQATSPAGNRGVQSEAISFDSGTTPPGRLPDAESSHGSPAGRRASPLKQKALRDVSATSHAGLAMPVPSLLTRFGCRL